MHPGILLLYIDEAAFNWILLCESNNKVEERKRNHSIKYSDNLTLVSYDLVMKTVQQ